MKTIESLLLCICFLGGPLLAPHLLIGQGDYEVLYVGKSTSTAARDGTTWAESFNNISDAIAKAKEKLGENDPPPYVEIWVKKGTYVEESGVILDDHIHLYGGFQGTETEENFEERDWREHKTILSGLKDADSQNHLTVVVNIKDKIDVVLDGFFIQDARNPTGSGGGIHIRNSLAVLGNLDISENVAKKGAGVYIEAGGDDSKIITLFNAIVHANKGLESEDDETSQRLLGGGIYVEGTEGKVLLLNVLVYENIAHKGAGIYLAGRGHRVVHATVYGNNGVSAESASTDGLGVYVDPDAEDIIVVNSVLEGNGAADTGSQFHYGDNPISPTVRNSILREGAGGIEAASVYSVDSGLEKTKGGGDHKYLNLPANTPQEGGRDLPFIVDKGDPEVLDYINDIKGQIEVEHIKDLIDFTSDLSGNRRRRGTSYDLGVYEYQGRRDISVWYVNQSSRATEGQTQDGNGWPRAFQILTKAVLHARVDDQIWIAAGTYLPNENNDRDQPFYLQNIEVYGGFKGTEESLEDRESGKYRTILTGKLKENASRGDHAKSVVLIPVGASKLLLDEIIIIDGNADTGDEDEKLSGGGIYVSERTESNRSIILNKVRIYNCQASGPGAALYAHDAGQIKVYNSILSSNQSGGFGGGVFVSGQTELEVVNSTLYKNRGTNGGGAIYADGRENELSVKLYNTLLYKNQIVGDVAEGSDIFYRKGSDSEFEVAHIFVGTPSKSIEGLEVQNIKGLVTGDPLFIAEISEDIDGRNYLYPHGDSPLRNKGKASYIPEGYEIDVMGRERVFEEHPDIGAHEFVNHVIVLRFSAVVEIGQTEAGFVTTPQELENILGEEDDTLDFYIRVVPASEDELSVTKLRTETEAIKIAYGEQKKLDLTELSPGTKYVIYYLAVDKWGNQSAFSKQTFTTKVGEGQGSPLSVNTYLKHQKEVHVFPNPASDDLHVEAPYPITEIQIWNVQGKLVAHDEIYAPGKKLSIPTQKLSKGVYVLHVQTTEQSYKSEIIKR
ncbi:MAG: T9SS type A sorting domain-containing protein [Cytophagales bacterium]|nr:T9SS type A sorting domain-containing protein [Cytophagales bacterium]